MSSLFDDNFLAGLDAAHGPSDAGPPPPPEPQDGPDGEDVPHDLFGDRFDGPPPERDAHYRDGAARPVADPAQLLEGLNEQQRAAVVHHGGPLLIVAGAGSGKTRVLTHRIAHLLGARHVHPGAILAITFTNKAAGEMKERVEDLVGPRANAMWVSTFHSACVRILRRESKVLGFTSSFSIYDAADSKRLMALVCRDLDLDPKQYPPKSFSAKISNLKNELIDEETFAGQAENALREEARRGVRDVPGAAARGQRAGLRRHHHDHRQPAAGVPGRRRALPAPLPARPRRRVPGHQPRPVHPGPRTGRHRRLRRSPRPAGCPPRRAVRRR